VSLPPSGAAKPARRFSMDDSTTPAKTCTKCGETKPLDQFGRDKTKRDGRDSACRPCETARKRAYIAADRAAHRARCKDWAARNPAAALRLSREWRDRNAEKEAERHRRNYAANPEQRRAAVRKSYQRHREKRLAHDRAHHAAKRDQYRAYNRKYRAENPDKCREWAAKRRAIKLATQTEPVNYAAVFARSKGVCHICGQSVAGGPYHFDHVIPLSKGGTHTEDNIAVAHASCNQRKWNKLL
jgi:5-methylcytosine-specific restriction endonuclease McrA